MPHAEVVKFTQGSFFSKWAAPFFFLFFFFIRLPPCPPVTSISLGHLLPITRCLLLTIYSAVCLSVTFPPMPSPFSDLSPSPPPPPHSLSLSLSLSLCLTHTHTHTHSHTHTSSIAIPERSRLVWQWVGLCPWTQWHPSLPLHYTTMALPKPGGHTAVKIRGGSSCKRKKKKKKRCMHKPNTHTH